MQSNACVMDEGAVNRALSRISHEIVEKNGADKDICLIGIISRGAPLADALAAKTKALGARVETGYLDVTLYRDDLTESEKRPKSDATKIDFPIEGKIVIMVDDVLFTGRTARAAMDAVASLGRPAKIQFAVLVDRGHRELPISADYVGKNVPTSKSEVVSVEIPPFDKKTGVVIRRK